MFLMSNVYASMKQCYWLFMDMLVLNSISQRAAQTAKKSIYFIGGGAPPHPHTPKGQPLPRPFPAEKWISTCLYRIPRIFVHRCKVDWPCTSEKNPRELFQPVCGKIDLQRLLPWEKPNIQFSLAPIGTIPWQFFHRCRVSWRCTGVHFSRNWPFLKQKEKDVIPRGTRLKRKSENLRFL